MRTKDRTWLAVLSVVVGAAAATLAQTGAELKQPPLTPAPMPASQPAGTQPTSGPGPRLEVSPTAFDFGVVWQGMPAKREFSIKNAGDAPLTLSATSSCGCTVATTPKSPLAPGESSSFSISYDTANHLGPAQKKVTLTTNDPARRAVEIKVMGNVKPLYLANPSDNIVFQDLEVNSKESQTIHLTNKYDEPLHLKLKSDEDFGPFEITLKETKPGAEYELTATTKPPLKLGSNRTAVTLETGVEKVPKFTIRVFGNAQPRVLASPPTLVVTSAASGSTQQEVRIQYRKSTPIKITEVKPSLASIKCELQPPDPPRAEARIGFLRIHVTLPAFAAIPDEGARLEIFTDDPSEAYRKLVVPIVKRAAPARAAPSNSRPVSQPPGQKPTGPATGGSK